GARHADEQGGYPPEVLAAGPQQSGDGPDDQTRNDETDHYFSLSNGLGHVAVTTSPSLPGHPPVANVGQGRIDDVIWAIRVLTARESPSGKRRTWKVSTAMPSRPPTLARRLSRPASSRAATISASRPIRSAHCTL